MAAPNRPRSKWARIRRVVRIVWVSAGLTVMLLLMLAYRARGFDARVLERDERVTVEDAATHIGFQPILTARTAGLVFLPGGMVDPKAYAPLVRALADAGYPAFIVRMPFLGRHAVTESHKQELLARAERLIAGEPTRRWVVAGHSFGAAMAVRFAAEQPARTAQLVLIGTTHPRELDLSRSGLPVTRIVGTADGVADLERVRENSRNLPPDTRWICIEGGNHAQFGWYGPQPGDRRAALTREEQQRRTIEALIDVLARAEGGPATLSASSAGCP
jgi:pimeloyl-ACP methyl ester carboxylesterase